MRFHSFAIMEPMNLKYIYNTMKKADYAHF